MWHIINKLLSKNFLKKLKKHDLKCLLFLILLVVLLNSLKRGFSHDELEAIHSAWKIHKGEKIYVDFFQHHHPLLYYLLIPVLTIIGENTTSLIAMRILIFLILTMIFIITYFLAKSFFNQKVALISLILLSTTLIFVNRAIEIRPDVPQTLWGISSILFYFLYKQKKKTKYLILSSLSLSLSFLFLQKTIFLIFLLSILWVSDLLKKEASFKKAFLYFLIFSVPILLFLSTFFLNGTLQQYYQLNWILNTKKIQSFLPLAYMGETYRQNGLFWAFYVLGLSLFLKRKKDKQLGFLSLGLLISLFFYPSPYRQYFMMAIPLVAVISAYSIYSIFKKNKIMLFVFLPIVVIFPLFLLTKQLKTRTNDKRLEKINYVLSLTEKQDFVYDGDIQFNIFRKDLDFFWYSIKPGRGLRKYQMITDYKYNIYELVEKKKPRVISNYYIENMHDQRIFHNYQQSERYNDLFIRIGQ